MSASTDLSGLLGQFASTSADGIGGGTTEPATDPTTGQPVSSGTAAVDTSGTGGGFDWSTVFNNAGKILTGGAAVINAVNKTPQTQIVQPNGSGILGITATNMTWVYIGLALFVLVILFLIFKK